VLTPSQQRVQPQRAGHRGPGEAGGVGCPAARAADHDRGAGVIDQELSLAAEHVVGAGRVRADALPGAAHGAADDLFAERPTFGVVSVEQVRRGRGA